MDVDQDVLVEMAAELLIGRQTKPLEMLGADQAGAGHRIANVKGINPRCHQLLCSLDHRLRLHVHYGADEPWTVEEVGQGLHSAAQIDNCVNAANAIACLLVQHKQVITDTFHFHRLRPDEKTETVTIHFLHKTDDVVVNDGWVFEATLQTIKPVALAVQFVDADGGVVRNLWHGRNAFGWLPTHGCAH